MEITMSATTLPVEVEGLLRVAPPPAGARTHRDGIDARAMKPSPHGTKREARTITRIASACHFPLVLAKRNGLRWRGESYRIQIA